MQQQVITDIIFLISIQATKMKESPAEPPTFVEDPNVASETGMVARIHGLIV